MSNVGKMQAALELDATPFVKAMRAADAEAGAGAERISKHGVRMSGPTKEIFEWIHHSERLEHRITRISFAISSLGQSLSNIGEEGETATGILEAIGQAGLLSGTVPGVAVGAMGILGSKAWEEWHKGEEIAKDKLKEVEAAAVKAVHAMRLAKFGDDSLESKMRKIVDLAHEHERVQYAVNDVIAEQVRLFNDAEEQQRKSNIGKKRADIDRGEANDLLLLGPKDEMGAERVKRAAQLERIALEKQEREEEIQHAEKMRSEHLATLQMNLAAATNTEQELRAQKEAADAAYNQAHASEQQAKATVDELKQKPLETKTVVNRFGLGGEMIPRENRTIEVPVETDEERNKKLIEANEHLQKSGVVGADAARAQKEAEHALTEAVSKRVDLEMQIGAIKKTNAAFDKAQAAKQSESDSIDAAQRSQEELRHKQAMDAMRGDFHIPVDAMARTGLFVQGRGAATSDHNRNIADNTRNTFETLLRIEGKLSARQQAVWEN